LADNAKPVILILEMTRHTRAWQLFAAVVGLLGLIVVPLAAADSTAVTQQYNSAGSIQEGMIVRLATNDAASVVPLETSKAQQMLGITVSPNDAALTLSGSDSSHGVFVATSGRYKVLVSDQNGPIATNDYISISALDGVGMKATGKQQTVLGRAAESFTGSSNVVGSSTLTTADNKKIQVSLGRVAVDIGVGKNPQYVQEQPIGNIGFLRDFSNGVAGKTVSVPRLYLALAIILVSAVMAGSVLYGGVRSGILAIGRNPLAKATISKGLIQVVLTSVVIFVIGLFAVYLILKL
jgi:hypothetical protein